MNASSTTVCQKASQEGPWQFSLVYLPESCLGANEEAPHLFSRGWGGVGETEAIGGIGQTAPHHGSHAGEPRAHTSFFDHLVPLGINGPLKAENPHSLLPSLPSAFSHIIMDISPYQTGDPAGGPPWISHKTVKRGTGSQTGPVP